MKQLVFDFSPVLQCDYDNECPYPELHYYGIIQEDSHIRAHVGPVAKYVYVYKTADMVQSIVENKYRKCPAYQPDFVGVTGYGPVVPLSKVPFVIAVKWWSVEWWKCFKETDSTTLKGKKAVNVVSDIMRIGRFPLFVVPQEVSDIEMDIKGTDIIVFGKWKIQVKCDWKAGPKELEGCTGNLFIQTHERNPRGMH